jgi:DNA-binding MarR family transcriptional regulator
MEAMMPTDVVPSSEECSCLAVRQAPRHVTQFYDQIMAPAGLTTQFSILAKLQRLGPLTINALAAKMVMDRTTLGRTIQPLLRQGLVAVVRGPADRRSRELHLTDAGADRLRGAVKLWIRAQDRFAEIFDSERTAELRALMRAVSAGELVRGLS